MGCGSSLTRYLALSLWFHSHGWIVRYAYFYHSKYGYCTSIETMCSCMLLLVIDQLLYYPAVVLAIGKSTSITQFINNNRLKDASHIHVHTSQ